jgi:UDP-N-acetylglucosamine--N-acetylmuramyl-(pentapeptide) pyrophosphoryl-undecaprenol N-acetylglucosamine transferase
MYSFIKSFFYLVTKKPTDVITTGGIVAIPVCIAAYTLRIPITLFSLDAVPGKAIKMLAPLATTIATCFEPSKQFFPKSTCSIAPYPVKFSQQDKQIDQKTARLSLDLNESKQTILFLGGSQGSLFLNQCAQKLVDSTLFSPDTTQIIHQTGATDATDWNTLYKNKGVTSHVFSFCHNLAPMYVAADVIICRAGAGTLFEILFFEKECIVIPLKAQTTDHQVDNARAIVHMHPDIFDYILQEEVEKNYNLLFTKLQTTRLHQDLDSTLSPRM